MTHIVMIFSSLILYVEMAANGMFGAGANGMINEPDPEKFYSISMCEVAVLNKKVKALIQDLKIVTDLVKV